MNPPTHEVIIKYELRSPDKHLMRRGTREECFVYLRALCPPRFRKNYEALGWSVQPYHIDRTPAEDIPP